MKKVKVKPKKVTVKSVKEIPAKIKNRKVDTREDGVRKALIKQVDGLEAFHDTLDKMLSNSNDDTKHERERIASLSEHCISKVDPTEAYGYTKFPAPIADYLDYIKSTKNNLKSWGDLRSFIKNTDMYWKTMRDQSLKISIDFANTCIRESNVYNIPNSHNRFYDKPFYRDIIEAYISELNRESEDDAHRFKAREVLLKMILDYSEHESKIENSVKEQECNPTPADKD